MDDEVRIYGETGQPVLLIPGGNVTCDGFYPELIEALLDDPGARVIVHDRPGTGSSRTEGTIAGATRHLHALIRRLGMGPVVVVGQSLGGGIALLLAHDYPDDVAGIVFLDGTPVNAEGVTRQVEQSLMDGAAAVTDPAARADVDEATAAWVESEIENHRMRPPQAEAMRRSFQIDKARLADYARGLGDIAATFDQTRLRPDIPAAIISADYPPGNELTDAGLAAHRRIATAFGTVATIWPGSLHTVHLSHPQETTEMVRDITRRAAGI
ncbi:alpha/beta fold hydrolase [Pseudonocardia sp. ICBG601]|uniref:alpha/beta fold hydrolase n=1 Tax=Pseudonocardia sp. ICBG601 TaxID=2846759 RepID=UPI001CF60692|nr:alpha/beta hydrolase [Pseudonocardia sp. ICBG601]